MKKLIQLTLIFTHLGLTVIAQNQQCGTMENLEEMQKKHPEVIQNMQAIEHFTQEWIKNNPNSKKQIPYQPLEPNYKSGKPNSKSLCGYDNTYFTTIAAPTTIGQVVSPSPNCTYGGEYVRVTGMVAGRVYRVSTIGVNNFDTQITIWIANGGYSCAHNDDWGGAQSEIYFNPLSNGSYDILIDEYNCISNSLCASLQIELVYTPRPVITIPVVVHVVHYGEPIGTGRNISAAQIQSQIDVLNEDYRRLNSDIYTTPSAFRGTSDDPLIEFCLAQQDEYGYPTTGIVRWLGSQPTWSNADIESIVKPNSIWDRDSYLNIWTLEFTSTTLLGYAQFPGGTANTDGVVIRYNAFGTTGNVNPPFNLGRTSTHEVGHWLNLRHIWGDENACAQDDFVDDTPMQTVSSSGCPSFPTTDACSPNYPGIMFLNYMDYSDDNCLSVFTYGQAGRMDAALFGPRVGLLSSVGCDPSTVNIDNIELSKRVSIYPNPSLGAFTMELQGVQQANISILNILGRKVFESQIESQRTTIDISEQPNGIYFLIITTNNSSTTKKIIIEK